jgi:hypothetical protein
VAETGDSVWGSYVGSLISIAGELASESISPSGGLGVRGRSMIEGLAMTVEELEYRYIMLAYLNLPVRRRIVRIPKQLKECFAVVDILAINAIE